MVDNNIYYVEIDSIQKNQKIGDTPKYCIPLTINAITVQGISYSDPYFSSFKLNYKMALGAPEYMNKSDYAFKSSVSIKRVEASTNSMRPLKEKSVKKHCEMNSETRMITNDDDSKRIYHDNNIQRYANGNKAFKSFANGDLTFDTLLGLALDEEKITRAMCEQRECDGWRIPRTLRLCGGGETSLNSAAGWGSPPAPSSNAGNWTGSGTQTNPPNNTQQQWNNTNQRPPASQADNASNSTNGNNGANSPNSPANVNCPPGSNGSNGNNANNTSSAKIEQLNSMREALFSQDGWGGQHVNQDTNWDVPGSPEPGSKVEPAAGGPPAWKPNVNNGTDLWEANLRNGGQPPAQPASKTPWGHTPTTNIGGTWGEDDDAADSANVWSGPPPQQWAAGPPQQQHWSVPKKDDWNNWGEPHRSQDPRLDTHRSQDPRAPNDPRHDPRNEIRGISGRLNGEMWGQHGQHQANKMIPGGGINQWNSQGPKDSIKGTGWDEPSPPAARRAASGFDDGTSLWAQRGVGGGMPGRGGPQGPPSQQRMPPTPTKPDAVWGAHSQRNGSWEDPHTPSWNDRDVGGWPDAGGPGLWPKHKPSGPGGAWPDDIGEWGGPKHPPGGPLTKQWPKELVWNSKQFRYLVEMGYKKEDVDSALRRCDMNTEEALDLLAAASRGEWRRDDHFQHVFPASGAPAVSPAVVHKLLSQPPPAPLHSYGSGGQPSAAQLRMLVQQIQMAVTTGYLNHQILNQPLAPQTLVLLNQLLQQIKALQQLVQQQSLAVSKGGNTNLAVQYSVQITKAKQQISALQGQITTQQAIYMKQQQGGGDLFKPNHDPLSQLQNNFADMAINKEPQTAYASSSNQQSRLNQWKLPSLDKDGESPEFSRAPGTAKSTTSPQLGQIGLQPDSTWGVDRSATGQGWGDGSDVADGKDTWGSHPPVYDLVPEFEPGKPWKGNQIKNAEDDPAMTPGSVVRSPLSLVAIKDSDILGGKTSPPSGSERSLSSSTWSYAPPATAAATAALKPPADAWGKARGAAPPPNKPWPQHNRQVPTWQASTWLLLKNLTAQIDGSTLKTLCVQHGPLQNFHLYLNQGIALARYSTREEAAKAQMALNNCVLSNTTIFAESPAESDVQMILQHLGSGGGGGWRGKEWPGFPSLWSEPEQRATPSLTNYLPPDLLGGESI